MLKASRFPSSGIHAAPKRHGPGLALRGPGRHFETSIVSLKAARHLHQALTLACRWNFALQKSLITQISP